MCNEKSVYCIARGCCTYLNLTRSTHWMVVFFPVSWNTTLVKCQFVLRSLVAFAMYILPCFCTKIVKHWNFSSRDRSLFMSDINLHRQGQGGCERGGQKWCLFTEPWGRTLANGWAALSCWNYCSLGTFLGFAMIRADL